MEMQPEIISPRFSFRQAGINPQVHPRICLGKCCDAVGLKMVADERPPHIWPDAPTLSGEYGSNSQRSGERASVLAVCILGANSLFDSLSETFETLLLAGFCNEFPKVLCAGVSLRL